jgi:DNA-binding NtrC family response regulator
VRELINVIERAMLLCNDDKISLADLPETVSGRSELEHAQITPASIMQEADSVSEEWLQKPLNEVRKEILERFEHTYLTGLLRLTGGRIGETAKRAGIQPRSLFDKMKRHGLRKEDFRPKKAS